MSQCIVAMENPGNRDVYHETLPEGTTADYVAFPEIDPTDYYNTHDLNYVTTGSTPDFTGTLLFDTDSGMIGGCPGSSDASVCH